LEQTIATRPATLRQCAILAAGRATGVEVGGRPLVAWLMREMLRFGVDEFLFLTEQLPRAVEHAVLAAAAMLPRRVAVSFSEQPHRAGTGGALWHAAAQLHPRFLLCNGDSLFDCNIAALLCDFAKDGPDVLARMVVREGAPTAGRGIVTMVGDGSDAAAASGAGRINAGIYALDRRLLDSLSPSCSLECDLLPLLARGGRLRATVLHGWLVKFEAPADLARAHSEISAALHRRALFLDRDGVLNHDHGYVASVDRWDWVDGARAAVAAATAAGWHVFVVTNQSGVARGLYGEAEVEALLGWLADELRRAGGTLDDWRYCPYLVDGTLDAYRRDSDWRKPGPGMLNDLLRVWELNPARCVMIGDKPSDMQAAAAAGMRGVLFDGGNLLDTVRGLL
jgi:D,D-heptose 1,7-bisphosphate phosphatase